jgi:hypothetical protein
MMNATTNSPRPRNQRGARLWFGFAAPWLAFATDGFIAYVITWRTCFIGHGHLGSLSEGSVRWLLTGITIVLFFISLAGGIHSYRNWRSISRSQSFFEAEASGTAEFVSMLGVLSSTFMSVGIFWISLPLIMIGVCMRSH